MNCRMVEAGVAAQLKRDVEKLQMGIYALQYGVRELAERQRETAGLRGQHKAATDAARHLTATEKEVCQTLGLSEESFRKSPQLP